MSVADPKDVSVRFLNETDVPDIAKYFYDSPDGFIESIGLNLKIFGTKREFIQKYLDHLKALSAKREKPKSVIVFFKDHKMGMHSSTHFIPNESLTMHAHFFDPAFRKMGIGPISSIKAAELFFEEFDLKEIIAKVPLKNGAPLRLMEKLGLTAVGNEILDWPQLTGPMEAKVFRVNFEEFQRLKKTFGI